MQPPGAPRAGCLSCRAGPVLGGHPHVDVSSSQVIMFAMDTLNGIAPDDLQAWKELCAANDDNLARIWLAERGWPRGAQGSVVDACWQAALVARTPKVLGVLHEEGITLANTPPLRKALNGLLQDILSYPGRTKDDDSLDAMWEAWPRVSPQQASFFAKLGEFGKLSRWLEKDAWKPKTQEFIEAYEDALVEKRPSDRVYLIRACLDHCPNLLQERPDWLAGVCLESLAEFDGKAAWSAQSRVRWGTMLEGFERLSSWGHQAVGVEGWLLRVCAGGFDDVARLATVLGNVGAPLPDTLQEREYFFHQVLAQDFLGATDPRLNKEPWHAWVTDPLSKKALSARKGSPSLAQWREWQMEASWSNSVAPAPRPRL